MVLNHRVPGAWLYVMDISGVVLPSGNLLPTIKWLVSARDDGDRLLSFPQKLRIQGPAPSLHIAPNPKKQAFFPSTPHQNFAPRHWPLPHCNRSFY
jgi:hypothetical protein